MFRYSSLSILEDLAYIRLVKTTDELFDSCDCKDRGRGKYCQMCGSKRNLTAVEATQFVVKNDSLVYKYPYDWYDPLDNFDKGTSAGKSFIKLLTEVTKFHPNLWYVFAAVTKKCDFMYINIADGKISIRKAVINSDDFIVDNMEFKKIL